MQLCPILSNDLSVTATSSHLPQSSLPEELTEEEELIRLLKETAPELSNTDIEGNGKAAKDTIEDVFSANIGNNSAGLLNFFKQSITNIALPEQAPVLETEIALQSKQRFV